MFANSLPLIAALLPLLTLTTQAAAAHSNQPPHLRHRRVLHHRRDIENKHPHVAMAQLPPRSNAGHADAKKLIKKSVKKRGQTCRTRGSSYSTSASYGDAAAVQTLSSSSDGEPVSSSAAWSDDSSSSSYVAAATPVAATLSNEQAWAPQVRNFPLAHSTFVFVLRTDTAERLPRLPTTGLRAPLPTAGLPARLPLLLGPSLPPLPAATLALGLPAPAFLPSLTRRSIFRLCHPFIIGFANLLTRSTCGYCNSDSDSPNGSEDWLNCGLDGAGWTPPTVTVDELIAAELTTDGVFSPCADYVDLFNQYAEQYGRESHSLHRL